MKNEPLKYFEKILLLKRYSKQTINNYVSHLRMAQGFFNNKSFISITDKDWFNYIFHLVNTKNIAASTQRQVVGSLKLFYKEVYNQDRDFGQLVVTQRESKIPDVLTVD